jgi:DNA-binding SARP family transcriptional activator
VEPLHESARTFRELRHAYQECLANLYLALAAHLAGKPERSRIAARRALQLSAAHDYAAAVLRVAALDAAFARWLAGMPSAPDGLDRKGEPSAPPAAAAVRPDAADLTIHLFGSIEVYRDADNKIPPKAWKLRRALEIFCYLAASRERRATKEKLIDALWGDARLSAIEKNFHPTISFLRGALNHGRQVPKNFILFERGAYFLNPAHRYNIDTERFETEIRAARSRAREKDLRAALTAYDQALALYRGPFLEEEYGAWVEAPRAHFETLYLDALAEAGRMHLEAGDAHASLSCQRRRLELDPLSEEASADLMRALASAGDRAGVEKEFERLTGILADEVGVEPSAETRRAYEAARAMKPAPLPAAAASPPHAGPLRSRPAPRRTRRS